MMLVFRLEMGQMAFEIGPWSGERKFSGRLPDLCPLHIIRMLLLEIIGQMLMVRICV